jgi:hypothetical protein
MKILILSILTILLVFSVTAVAFAAEVMPRGIQVILADIRQEQGLYSTDAINLSKISSEKLEELGDAVMAAMLDDRTMHLQMNANLGGQDSETLAALHRKIGYNYLADYPDGMMNLISSGLMNQSKGGFAGYFSRGSQLGSFGWGGLVMGFFLFLSVIANAVLLIQKKKGSVFNKASATAQPNK